MPRAQWTSTMPPIRLAASRKRNASPKCRVISYLSVSSAYSHAHTQQHVFGPFIKSYICAYPSAVHTPSPVIITMSGHSDAAERCYGSIYHRADGLQQNFRQNFHYARSSVSSRSICFSTELMLVSCASFSDLVSDSCSVCSVMMKNIETGLN